jgi:hypothetical protein
VFWVKIIPGIARVWWTRMGVGCCAGPICLAKIWEQGVNGSKWGGDKALLLWCPRRPLRDWMTDLQNLPVCYESLCLWTGFGSRCQVHRFLQSCWVFPHSIVTYVYLEWSTTQRTSSQLDTTVESTWASVPVERFRHLRVHAQMNWGCSFNSIRKVLLIFGILSVHWCVSRC